MCSVSTYCIACPSCIACCICNERVFKEVLERMGKKVLERMGEEVLEVANKTFEMDSSYFLY
jgi:hypothetical protein